MTRLLIGVIVSLLLTDCGFRCKKSDVDHRPIDSELLAYFGVFQTGNYWVYENTAKDKKDSIYVTYTNNFVRETNICSEYDVFQFTIQANGKDVVSKDMVCMEAEKNGINYSQTCLNDSIFFNLIGPMYFYSNEASSILLNVNKLTTVTLNNQIFNGEILQISGDNNHTGNDTIYLLRDKGIVGWQKNNDTYNVTQYLIL